MTEAKTPTLEQFRAYQAAYDYFNAALFGGELKPCLLNFRGRHNRNLGLFWPKRWGRLDGTVTHEIALNPDVLLRPLVETMATLVHEMCYQHRPGAQAAVKTTSVYVAFHTVQHDKEVSS